MSGQPFMGYEDDSFLECRAEVDRNFRGAYRLENQGDDETSAYFSETIRRYIEEGYRHHTCRRENLKSHLPVEYCLHHQSDGEISVCFKATTGRCIQEDCLLSLLAAMVT
jgi:hypothetical protein